MDSVHMNNEQSKVISIDNSEGLNIDKISMKTIGMIKTTNGHYFTQAQDADTPPYDWLPMVQFLLEVMEVGDIDNDVLEKIRQQSNQEIMKILQEEEKLHINHGIVSPPHERLLTPHQVLQQRRQSTLQPTARSRRNQGAQPSEDQDVILYPMSNQRHDETQRSRSMAGPYNDTGDNVRIQQQVEQADGLVRDHPRDGNRVPYHQSNAQGHSRSQNPQLLDPNLAQSRRRTVAHLDANHDVYQQNNQSGQRQHDPRNRRQQVNQPHHEESKISRRGNLNQASHSRERQATSSSQSMVIQQPQRQMDSQRVPKPSNRPLQSQQSQRPTPSMQQSRPSVNQQQMRTSRNFDSQNAFANQSNGDVGMISTSQRNAPSSHGNQKNQNQNQQNQPKRIVKKRTRDEHEDTNIEEDDPYFANQPNISRRKLNRNVQQQEPVRDEEEDKEENDYIHLNHRDSNTLRSRQNNNVSGSQKRRNVQRGGNNSSSRQRNNNGPARNSRPITFVDESDANSESSKDGNQPAVAQNHQASNGRQANHAVQSNHTLQDDQNRQSRHTNQGNQHRSFNQARLAQQIQQLFRSRQQNESDNGDESGYPESSVILNNGDQNINYQRNIQRAANIRGQLDSDEEQKQEDSGEFDDDPSEPGESGTISNSDDIDSEQQSYQGTTRSNQNQQPVQQVLQVHQPQRVSRPSVLRSAYWCIKVRLMVL
eukprot:403340296